MKQKNYDGFTIIETLLALAIGGLILAMVFIAAPTLFANQRDGQRRDDVLLFITKLKNFQSNNNRGALPTATADEQSNGINGNSIAFGPTTGTTWTDFYKSFFNDSFADPSTGAKYNWRLADCGTTKAGKCTNSAITSIGEKTFEANNSTMWIVKGATCDGPNAVYSANQRNVAVLYRLEQSAVFCANT